MVYNTTFPEMVLLKRGKPGMTLDAYRIRYPDGTYVMDPKTKRPMLFAANQMEWNKAQAAYFGSRGSAMMDPDKDLETHIGKQEAENIAQGTGILTAGAGTLLSAGASAGTVAVEQGARMAGQTIEMDTLATTSGRLLNVSQGGLRQRVGASTANELIGTQYGGSAGRTAVTETLGTTTAGRAAPSAAAQAGKAGFITTMATGREASMMKLKDRLSPHDVSTTRENIPELTNLRRPIHPPKPQGPDEPPSDLADMLNRHAQYRATSIVRPSQPRSIEGVRGSESVPAPSLQDMRAAVIGATTELRGMRGMRGGG